MAVVGRPQPEVPVLEAVPDALVVAADGQVDVAADHGRRLDEVLAQERVSLVEAPPPEVVGRPEADAVALGEREFRTGLEAPQGLLHGRRLEEVVAVELLDVGGPRRAHRRVAGGAEAAVLRVAEHAHPPVASLLCLDASARHGVGGAVVDDDPLPLLERLAEDALGRLLELGARVEERRDDRHRGGRIVGRCVIEAGPLARRGRVVEVGRRRVDHGAVRPCRSCHRHSRSQRAARMGGKW